jgi:hypothetical protein
MTETPASDKSFYSALVMLLLWLAKMRECGSRGRGIAGAHSSGIP